MASARVIAIALVVAVRCKGAEPPATTLAPDASVQDTGIDAGPNVPTVHALLLDPQLTQVREKVWAKDPRGAANALIALQLPSSPSVDYLLGLLLRDAQDDAAATQAFDRVTTGPLVPYAKLRSAQALSKLGKWDDAIAHVNGVTDIAIDDEAGIVTAEASIAKGDKATAIAAWRSVLSKRPKGPRWVDTAAHLAKVLVDDGANAKEAFDLATRIMVEAPQYEAQTNAPVLRQRARALDMTQPFTLTTDERAKRAQAWLDAMRPDTAITEAQDVLAQAKTDPDVACRAATTRAQATAKTRAPSSDAWGDAIAVCKDDALAFALYQGGKAAMGKTPDVALKRFDTLEKTFATHRLADDARLFEAAIAKDRGDDARAEALLLAVPTDFPDGDMKSEALFRVAHVRFKNADYRSAIDPLDRATALDAGKHAWATAGRAAYFRARAAQLTGDIDGAKTRYAQVIKDVPLTYYMALAHARLAEIDGAAAKAVIDAQHEPSSSWLTRDHPEVHAPGFDRATALLDVGEIDAARRELIACSVLTDAADPELVWLAAYLFGRAGAPDIGAGMTRVRITDNTAHFPVGRWRFAWEAAYPRAFEPLVVQQSKGTGIATSLIWAIMREESTFMPEVKSVANAVGLMQLMPTTAKEVARGTPWPFDEGALKQPPVSIGLGAKLLASLRASFSPSVLAIPAYNAGGGAVRSWLTKKPGAAFDVWVEDIPYEETRGYIKRVLSSQVAYAWLYDTDALKELFFLPLLASSKSP